MKKLITMITDQPLTDMHLKINYGEIKAEVIYKNNIQMKIKYLLIGFSSLFFASCNKSLDTKPVDLIIASSQFATDKAANDAVVGIYSTMFSSLGSTAYSSDIAAYTGLSADELNTIDQVPNETALYNANTLSPKDGVAEQFWSESYNDIYQANAVIDNIAASTGMSAAAKSQLTGEAKFMRSFCYFYLVNMFGDVPLVTSSIYTNNVTTPRTPVKTVYQQIVTDLTAAASSLPDTYPTAGRVRANKASAQALLARVYLYTKDWADAEAESTLLLTNSTYSLENNFNNIFLNTSNEAILQFYATNGYTLYQFTVAPSVRSFGTTYHYDLNSDFVKTFEAGDLRALAYADTATINGSLIYYPYKYKNNGQAGTTEYYMGLRLSEQYLIRAEARAMQNKMPGAVADVNIIRHRAGLAPLPASFTQADLITSILHERRVELCYEFGQRWFDLKRSGTINAVMSAIKPNWKPTDALYPIPISEIFANKNLVQNPGY